MTRKKMMIAVAGASLLATSQVQAQISYSSDDLLLNFRNTANISGNDLEVDLGPVTSVASGVVASASLVTGVFGAPSTSVPIGLSAAAADAQGTTGTLWLTRVSTAANYAANVAPATPSGQQTFTSQNPVAIRIGNIGAGAAGGNTVAPGATTVPGGNTGSYQTQAEQNSGANTGIINYGSGENLATTKGGNIESIQNGSGNVYEALWTVPVTGTADTYIGTFLFKPSGEVDFLAAPSAVPEPATYGLLGGLGMLALTLRRRVGSLLA